MVISLSLCCILIFHIFLHSNHVLVSGSLHNGLTGQLCMTTSCLHLKEFTANCNSQMKSCFYTLNVTFSLNIFFFIRSSKLFSFFFFFYKDYLNQGACWFQLNVLHQFAGPIQTEGSVNLEDPSSCCCNYDFIDQNQ